MHRLLALLLLVTPALAQTKLQKADVTLAPPKNLKTKIAPGYTIPIVDIRETLIKERHTKQFIQRSRAQLFGPLC